MPLAYLRPGAVGTYDAWTLISGATKVIAVDIGGGAIPSHDDDVTIIDTIVNGNRQSFTVLGSSIPTAIGLVNSVSSCFRARGAGGATSVSSMLRLGANNVDSAAQGTTDGVYNSFVLPLARPGGGGSWSPVDITTSLQIGVLMVAFNGFDTYLTSNWGQLDYELPAGGWQEVVGSLAILALMGGAIALSEMPKLAHEITVRSHGNLIVRPHEYAAMYQELREGRHAKHFILRREL